MHSVCPLAFFFPTSPLRIPLFPDKAGCCLGLFRSFYYSFKTKAKVGITSQRTQKNLPPCPPWSTNLPRLWPNDPPNEVRTNDMWGDIGPTSFSFSRTEKKKPLSYFSQWSAVAERLLENIWRTAIWEKWASSPREKARKLLVHVDRLEREREPWVCMIWDEQGVAAKPRLHDCKTCTVSVARVKENGSGHARSSSP